MLSTRPLLKCENKFFCERCENEYFPINTHQIQSVIVGYSGYCMTGMSFVYLFIYLRLSAYINKTWALVSDLVRDSLYLNVIMQCHLSETCLIKYKYYIVHYILWDIYQRMYGVIEVLSCRRQIIIF